MLLVSQNGGDPQPIDLADALVAVNGETHVDSGSFIDLSTAMFRTKDYHTIRFYGSDGDIQRLIDDHNLPSPETRGAFEEALIAFVRTGWALSEIWGGPEQERIEQWLDGKRVRACLTMSFDEWLSAFSCITQKGA